MEFDKKTILAFLLIGLIIVFTQTDWYKEWAFPGYQEQTGRVESQEGLEEVDSGKVSAPEETQDREMMTPPEPKLERPPEMNETAEGDADGEDPYLHLKGEGETVVVETNLYRAELSTRGGTLKAWTLKRYLAADSSLVQMIGEDGHGNLTVLLPLEGDTLDTAPLIFTPNRKSLRLDRNHPTDSLRFVLNLGEGKLVRKTYRFYHDRYSVDLVVELVNVNRMVEGFSYLLGWRTGLQSTEANFEDDMNHAHFYAYQGGDAEKFDVGDTFNPSEWDNPTDWVAVRTKYFTAALIPVGEKIEAVSRVWGEALPIAGKGNWKKYAYTVEMPLYTDGATQDRFLVYVGPLDYDLLKSYNVYLEEMMDFGWALFRPFAKFVLWSFKGLHKVIPNYGVVIIVFSILIKIVLYPLTRKSYQSMKEMQALKPLMDEINQKYKDDPQKKQEAVMKLYREHGVNPLGGCIPMLLQMPLLIALFNVFRSTIQLRGASFVWWINDLSQPDTVATLPFSIPLYGDGVNVLPIFMGATTFVQQKIAITDPKQKAMVIFMPIFLTLLFNSFPSGLNLYYALFNLLSIAQEKLIPYHPKDPKELKKKGTTKRKKMDRIERWRRLKSS